MKILRQCFKPFIKTLGVAFIFNNKNHFVLNETNINDDFQMNETHKKSSDK